MTKASSVQARFDAERARDRVDNAKERAEAQAPGDGALAMKLTGKATATGAREVREFDLAALRTGAPMPTDWRLMKSSARIERAATPPGYDSAPAWVVRFEGNSPIARLARPARAGDAPALGRLHVRAAERLVALHDAAVKPPRVTASYDGAGGGSSIGVDCWIDIACDEWADMTAALGVLLPVERKIILEVVVHDTPIATLARARLVPMTQRIRAEAGVVQTLRLGLERLAHHWSLQSAA